MVRRKTRRTNIFSAMVLEIATLLGIIAIAQPTWSRLFIEAVSQRPVASQTATPSAAQSIPVAAVPKTVWPVLDPVNYTAQLPEMHAQAQPGSHRSHGQASPSGNAQQRFVQQPAAPNYHSGIPKYSFDDYK
jgi:hypothetical protein